MLARSGEPRSWPRCSRSRRSGRCAEASRRGGAEEPSRALACARAESEAEAASRHSWPCAPCAGAFFSACSACSSARRARAGSAHRAQLPRDPSRLVQACLGRFFLVRISTLAGATRKLRKLCLGECAAEFLWAFFSLEEMSLFGGKRKEKNSQRRGARRAAAPAPAIISGRDQAETRRARENMRA